MRKFDLSLRSSRSSYFATFRHQLTILSKTDALDEEKWLNMLGTFVKDWFRYESHFVHGRDSLVDILKERGLLSEWWGVGVCVCGVLWVLFFGFCFFFVCWGGFLGGVVVVGFFFFCCVFFFFFFFLVFGLLLT